MCENCSEGCNYIRKLLAMGLVGYGITISRKYGPLHERGILTDSGSDSNDHSVDDHSRST